MSIYDNQPTTGDWFVTKTSGKRIQRIFDWAIRFFTSYKGHKARVNHAGIYVGPTLKYPEGAIIEATSRMVQYASINKYPNAEWSTKRLPSNLIPDDVQRVKIQLAAESMLGDKYNWLDIFVIGLAQRRLGKIVDNDDWIARRLSADHREICSQAVDRACAEAGIHLFNDGRPEGLVSPQDLEDLLSR